MIDWGAISGFLALMACVGIATLRPFEPETWRWRLREDKDERVQGDSSTTHRPAA